MALIKKDIDFMSWKVRRVTGSISAVVVIFMLITIAVKGFQLGLDFTAGTLIEVGYQQAVNPDDVRRQLLESGFEDATVTTFGSDRDVLVRLPVEQAESSQMSDAASSLGVEVLAVLSANSATPVELRRSEFVGPRVGSELTEQAALAVLTAMIIIMIYVALRFQYKFGVSAVAAQLHDVIVVMGVISLFEISFDLTTLAALLAVIGYSLNDTIVVFDRVRENLRIARSSDVEEIINHSLNQVLARSFVTSVTTLLALWAMFIVGGEAIYSFSLSLIVGVSVGFFTSLFIACNFLMYFKVTKEDVAQMIRDENEVDSTP
ncbi:MAG: protein translocase subunit SecF [Pseudohongiella sp.]|nr:protein translocase subunit SecF [Pseudohongiella sp.]MDP2125965.1 protein translocase subunit SecF [Pseudohongiella sp.]